MRSFVETRLLLFLAVVVGVKCNPDYDTCPGDKGFGDGLQNCGYVRVREGAHMFWWLYRTTPEWATKPLIVWLSGGPGASSCGHGNFMGVGPLDENKRERANAWTKDFNVLFVDSPVGAGFSYVEDLRYLAIDNNQIAEDMVNLTKAFVTLFNNQFQTNPLYVYGDGYGGKIAVDYVKLLNEERAAERIRVNLRGLALGNAWASPVDSVLSYASFLHELGFVDDRERRLVDEQAEFTRSRYEAGAHYFATLEWLRTLALVTGLTGGLDFGNVLVKMPNDTSAQRRPSSANGLDTFDQTILDRLSYSRYYKNDSDEFAKFMDGEVREALKIPENVTWGKQALNTFENLYIDFMKPVTRSIEVLLNTTDIPIHICNGNLDILVDTSAQLHWIENLAWPKMEEFSEASKTIVWSDGYLEGYQKKGGGLYFYWMNVAGVDFFNENPKATRIFLRTMTGY